ncbi:MAG: hypothetical protein U9R37_00345 [Campylobacterota bacterium]|nr:hypothetical protein [Campylobacterota bacterium]
MLNLLIGKKLLLLTIIFAVCFSIIQLFIYKTYNDKRIQHIDGRVSSALKHYQVRSALC